MCYGCWEDAGSPIADRLETNRLALQLNGCDESGPLHCFVSDWNCEDEQLQAELKGVLNSFEREVVERALTLPLDQRFAALALADAYYGVEFKTSYEPGARY